MHLYSSNFLKRLFMVIDLSPFFYQSYSIYQWLILCAFFPVGLYSGRGGGRGQSNVLFLL